MTLMLFWLKIAAKRIIGLIKHSPVVFIGMAVIIAAFIIARNDIKRTMDMRTEIVTLAFFVFVSLLLSFRNYHTMPALMVYAKSGLRNKQLRLWFFVKQALANNVMFLLFGLASLTGFVIIESVAAIPAAILLSLLLSVSLMYLKNEYNSKKVNKITVKSAKLSPVIKSTISDYFSSGFLLTALLSTGLFAALMVLLMGNIQFLHELENPSIVCIGILLILSLGFMGISESDTRVNWKFFAIIYPRDFLYHIKRTMLFLGVFFGPQIALFIFTAAFFGPALLFRYLYCVAVVLLLSMHITFMLNHILIKAFILFPAAVVCTVWISTLQPVYLPVLVVPVLLTFLKANNEYRERYYL